jgi:hypothetical protein
MLNRRQPVASGRRRVCPCENETTLSSIGLAYHLPSSAASEGAEPELGSLVDRVPGTVSLTCDARTVCVIITSLLPHLCESRAATRAELASQARDVFLQQPLQPGRAHRRAPDSRAPTPCSTASPRGSRPTCTRVRPRRPPRPGPARHPGTERHGTALHGTARHGTAARLDTTLARRCEERLTRGGARRHAAEADDHLQLCPTREAEEKEKKHGRAHAHARYRVRSRTSAKCLAKLTATKTRVKCGTTQMRKTLKLR